MCERTASGCDSRYILALCTRTNDVVVCTATVRRACEAPFDGRDCALAHSIITAASNPLNRQEIVLWPICTRSRRMERRGVDMKSEIENMMEEKVKKIVMAHHVPFSSNSVFSSSTFFLVSLSFIVCRRSQPFVENAP